MVNGIPYFQESLDFTAKFPIIESETWARKSESRDEAEVPHFFPETTVSRWNIRRVREGRQTQQIYSQLRNATVGTCLNDDWRCCERHSVPLFEQFVLLPCFCAARRVASWPLQHHGDPADKIKNNTRFCRPTISRRDLRSLLHMCS